MRTIFLTLLLIFLSTLSVYAEQNEPKQNLSYWEFSKLPVLHQGRVKPLDSLARNYLKKWADTHYLEGKPPSAWLAMILFDPANASSQRLFYLRNESVLRQLGLKKTDQRFFSLEELLSGLDSTKDQLTELLKKDPNTLTASQQEFLSIHENAAALSNLMRSFSLYLPLNVVLPAIYQDQFEGKTLNYANISTIELELIDRLQNIIQIKGEDPQEYSEEEQKIALLAFQIQSLSATGRTSNNLKIVPSSWDEKSELWYSPWELIRGGYGSPESALYLKQWQDLSSAYRDLNADAWNKTITQINDTVLAKDVYSPFKFSLEKMYHAVKPYNWASMLYTLAGVLALVFLKNQKQIWMRLSWILTAFGALAHTLAITSRVIILDRPPVGTLYESVIFVSLVCALGALFFIFKKGNPLGYLAGLISALILLFLAPAILPEGESLEVLVAVLNTSFWLATHVIVITAGYAVCLLCACMAHFYLYLRIRRDKKEDQLLKLYTLTYHTSLLALLLTSIGTILGGIWADQSWGRFWGWDPKENGALLIVLWLIWIQHGRISGHLKDVPFMSMMAFLNIIVAIAWFGVNLLGVGLHSYGFTSGLALGLAVFCTVETLLIAYLWMSVRRSEKKASHAT